MSILIEKENIEIIKNKFKNIEIIIFADKKIENDIAYFNSKGIFKIYSNDKTGYDYCLKNLIHENIEEQVKTDMIDFKKEILEKQIYLINNNFESKKLSKVILVSGARGVGKSIFTSIFSKQIEKYKKNVCILDCSQDYSSINIIFGKVIKEKIQKISKNIFYIKMKNICEEISYLNFEKIIEELKIKYDYILVDSNFEFFFNNNIQSFFDKILFLVEPNLVELQKAKRILEIYEHDLGISNFKIKIIFNRVNKFYISEEILKEIFAPYEIISYINYNPEYTLFINKNTRHLIKDKNYDEIYKKIFE